MGKVELQGTAWKKKSLLQLVILAPPRREIISLDQCLPSRGSVQKPRGHQAQKSKLKTRPVREKCNSERVERMKSPSPLKPSGESITAVSCSLLIKLKLKKCFYSKLYEKTSAQARLDLKSWFHIPLILVMVVL